jgi:hypothetical protein
MFTNRPRQQHTTDHHKLHGLRTRQNLSKLGGNILQIIRSYMPKLHVFYYIGLYCV